MAQDPGNDIVIQQNQPQVAPLELLKTQEDCRKYADMVTQFYPTAEVIKIPGVENPRSLVLNVEMEIGINHFLIIHPVINEKKGDMDEYHANLYFLTKNYTVDRAALTVLMPGGSGDLSVANSYKADRAIIPITHAIVPSNKAHMIRTIVKTANLFRYKGVNIIDMNALRVDPSMPFAKEEWGNAFRKVDGNIIEHYSAEK
jgi:hypothetical protein